MRLIDADVLIENLTDEITNLRLNGLKGTPRQTSDLYDFIDRIKEQPTAYNVDAVVEELEKTSCLIQSEEGTGWLNFTDDAIAIVRKGGVNE